MQESWLDSWIDSSVLLIPVYQIRIQVSRDDILQISDSKIKSISLVIALDSWSHQRDSESRRTLELAITIYPSSSYIIPLGTC